MTETQANELDSKAHALLRRFYGYESFRPMQLDIIHSIMEGNDTLVLMPTGGGKSICFQMPALLAPHGVTIVVSPLIALMRDQVEALLANGIPAAAIHTNQTEAENRAIMDGVYSGHIKLLYISPERLLVELERLGDQLDVAFIAIDEAHCISQWGHDFRKEYTKLGVLKEHFPSVPVMALTATADKTTREDIMQQLRLKNPNIFISSFDRPNISLTVLSGYKKPQKLRRIKALMRKYPGDSGIVYCMSRKGAESMAEDLVDMGYRAAAYHAGMDPAERTATQQQFINGDLQIVCATIAFGMGIDKSNIRWVVHNNMPKTIESYYQEIGRAGRDGLPAEAIMFFSANDLITLQAFVDESGQRELLQEKLDRMRRYVDAQVCRRRVLLSYFNEEADHDCGNCDVCLDPPERFDGTRFAQMALSAIVRTEGKANIRLLVDLLRGSSRDEVVKRGYNHLKTYGVGRELSYGEWLHYMTQMLQLGLYDIEYANHNKLVVTPYGQRVLFRGEPVMLARYISDWRKVKAPAKPQKEKDSNAAYSPKLFAELKALRSAIAKKEGVPGYIVFSDKTLTDMARRRPTSRIEFSLVEGVGDYKSERYWLPFVNLIRESEGAQPFPDNTSVKAKINEQLHEGVPVAEIGRRLEMTEQQVYREICRMINDDKFSDFDLVISREKFVDIMDKNKKFDEAHFRTAVHALYPAGLEDVALAMAAWLLRRRAEQR